jgi:hypothetical protein
MPFVEGGIVVDAEPQQQAAPPMAQGGFVQGGIEVDPTPDDSYNKVLQFQAAQTDYTPSKQEFLDYLKVSKTKPLLGEKPLETIGTAAVQTVEDIASMPYKLGEAIGQYMDPPEGVTPMQVAGGTAAEIAVQSRLKAENMGRGLIDTALNKLSDITGKLRNDDDKYEAFLAAAEIKRQLARANAPGDQRVPASQDVLQAYGIPEEAISQQGLDVGGFLADPSSIAFAGGGKLASALAQRAIPLIPRAGQILQRTGERISNLGRGPENIAGRITAGITGSEQMGQAVQEGIAKGTTGITLGEAAGLPITMNVPGLGTVAKTITATKGLGGAMETVGEAGTVSGGPSLTATQRGLLGTGERIAAAEGASSRARALGTALARSGLETPVRGAATILLPMAGAGAAGGALAALTGEEGDAVAAAIGSGAGFGVFDGGFTLAKAVQANAFNGGRVRQTAVDDLNTRPTDVQFTYIDPVAGEQTATIKDSDARATLYGRLNNKQLTKALSEVAGAEGAGVDVIFHTDADTVPAGLQNVNYAGVAIGPDNIKSGKPTILINVDKASPEALPHEILHARITQDMVSQLGAKAIDTASADPNFQRQFTDFANKYADKLQSAGGRVVADRIRTELRDAFDPAQQRAQKVESLKRITDEFAAYYTQEMLKGKDPKTMLPGRIPSFIEMALNNAKEAVSERFTRRALQAGFDPVARTFYDANGRRIKLDWMEDAIKNLVTPKEGYEPTEQRVDINKMTQAQQNAVIMARGYSDLFMTAPDGSIVRPLSKAELAAKTADVANRTMRVVESVPQAERTSISGMDAYGNPVIEGRLSLAEADAVSKSGIFGPSSSRTLIDIATAIRDGTLMEGNYWKVYGSTGKSGVFGESQKLFLPYGISINSKGGVNVKVVDWGKVQARMYKALSKPAYKSLFNNYDQAMSTMRDVYLKNIAETGAVPSAEALGGGIEGAKKRNMFNEIMGAVPKKGDVMVNFPTAGYVANRKGGSVYQDLRLERIQNADSTKAQIPWTGDMGEQSSYRRTQLNFMPAEAIGETRVSTDENGGYRILSKNGKFRLYSPDGSTVGIFDTQEQAKLKAEKDYATQERLQPEISQQQRPLGDEGRQATEAGGRNRIERGQEGQVEGGAVRQAGDVGVRLSGETGELKNDVRFQPDPNQIIKSFDDLLSGNDLKTKYEKRPYKSNDMVVSTPSGDTHSRVLPSRAPMVGSAVPDSIPSHLKFKSKADLDQFIDAGLSWMRQNEHKFGNSEITPWFYDKMYLAADALAGGDMNRADLYLRLFAYLSPRTAVPANYTKSYSSGIVPFLGHFPSGNRAGTFDQTRAISQIINEWKNGEHFGYRTKGVDNKVYNFYLNGAAGLVKNAISKGVDLPPGVKSHPVLSDPLTLSRLSTNDMWQMMAFSKIAEDLGVRGNVWPGMVIKGNNKGFMWSDPKDGRTVDLTSNDALEVKRILSASGENAVKNDPGAWDWSKLTPEESSALMYDPVKKTIMVFNQGTDAGLSAKGQGALYDHVQALSGMLADKINQAGGYAGKPHLDAYNVQELLWAIIKQENPKPEMRDYESYLAPAQELFSYVDRGMEGETPKSVVSANKSFNRWAEQLASAEIDTSASSEWKTQMEVDRQRLTQAGDASPDVSIANEIAKRLPKWVEKVVNDNDWNVTLDDVSVDVGAYMGSGDQVIANTAIYLRGSGADFGKLDQFMRDAGSQQGGNHIRPMRLEEQLLLDRNNSGQVSNISEELDTTLANVLSFKGAQKLSKADVVNLVSKLSELTDSEGKKFLTGLSRIGDEIVIHDRYYRGSWETGQFEPFKYTETSQTFLDAVKENSQSIKNIVDQFGLKGEELTRKVVTAKSNPNFEYEGQEAIDRSRAASKPARVESKNKRVQPKSKGPGKVQPEPFYGLRGLYLDASRSAAPSQGVGFSWQYDPLQRTKSVLESKLEAKQGKMDVGNSPSRLELKLSQEDKSRVSQLAVDSAVISAPDNRSMLRVTLEPGIAEEIFDSIQALVAGTEVDVTKLALRGSSEFIPTKNPVIKQAMAQATGELTGEKAALVEQLGKYQDLRKAVKTPPQKPFAAQVEKYTGFLEGKTGSTKRQLNSLLDRVDTMVQRGMLTESQANKITRRTPGEPKRSATESGQQRFMPAGDREVTRAVNINDFSQDFTGQILNGQKTIETRDTLNNAMQGVLGQRIGLVRTGIKDTKVVGYATVAKQPIVYRDEAEFRRDEENHLVAPGSPYDIKKGGVKYGYELTDVVPVEPFAPKSVGRMYSVIEPKRYMPETIQRDVGRNQDFANPPTDTEAVDALSSEKKAKFGAARSIKPGTQVAARIDIPAFLRTGKYVVAVHEPDGAAGGPGKVIGYDTVTRLQNPKFVVKPGVQRIYEGKSAKFPVATVDGKIMADRSIPADLENYVAVGMDPKEHAFFYDKRTDQPVIGGSEAVSVGNTVFVKNPVYGKPEDFRYMPQPDSAMPGAYSFPGGYRALPGKAKGSLRIYGPAGSLIGIASSLDEAQRILRRKNK